MPAPRSWASAGRPARTVPSRRRGGDRQPAPRGRHRGRPGHPVQHHRLVDAQPVRGDRGRRGDPPAADPEANIIFGTSFNERLGDEVMITVIATGFDGGKKRQTLAPRVAAGRHGLARPAAGRRASATSSTSCSASATRRPTAAPIRTACPARRRSTTRRPPSARPACRALGRRAPARHAPGDDLRRRRPGDPELPPPEVTGAGPEPAVQR